MWLEPSLGSTLLACFLPRLLTGPLSSEATSWLCLSHEVRRLLSVSHLFKRLRPSSGQAFSPPQTLAGPQALPQCWHRRSRLPLRCLSGNLLHRPSSLPAYKRPPLLSPQPLQSQAHRQGVAVGSGEGATDIGILLAAHLNNLMAISRASVVVGEGGTGGRFIERIHSRLGFCLPLFSWHLSCMF